MHNAHPHALNNNNPKATFALGIEAYLPEIKCVPALSRKETYKNNKRH